MSKVLIAVDMQRDFIDGSLGSEAAKSIVKPVADYIKHCKDNGFIIITTRDEHDADFAETKEGKAFPEHCLKWEDGFMLAPEIKDVLDPDDDYCICKPTFGSLDLVNLLLTLDEEEGIDEIQICGLVTDICVLANTVLIASAFPNTQITVLRDLCAGTSVGRHQIALELMQNLLVDVMNSGCLHCGSNESCNCADKEGCSLESCDCCEGGCHCGDCDRCSPEE